MINNNNFQQEVPVAGTCDIDGGTSTKAPISDPISQLVQYQQGRKEKEPTFTVISEKGVPRQPEFVVQVVVGSFVATGVGPKKKDAKRAAAIKALEALSITAESPEMVSYSKEASKNSDSM